MHKRTNAQTHKRTKRTQRTQRTQTHKHTNATTPQRTQPKSHGTEHDAREEFPTVQQATAATAAANERVAGHEQRGPHVHSQQHTLA